MERDRKMAGERLGRDRDAMPQHGARYAVFHCMDNDDMSLYYESLDLHGAAHPQTVLALKLNDAPLDPARCAGAFARPDAARLQECEMGPPHRAGRSFSAKIGAGKGGYWEDNGYEWYAGI